MDEPTTSALTNVDEDNEASTSSKKYSSRLRRVHKRKQHIDLLQDSPSCEPFSYRQHNEKSQIFTKNRHHFLWIIGVLSCILLILLCYSSLTAHLWRNPHRTTHGRTKTSLRTVYSGTSSHEGELWIINRHQFRRKRSIRDHGGSSQQGKVYGLARECGRHCSLRLKAGENEQEIHARFSRFKLSSKSHHRKSPSTHEFKTRNVVPLVQYMDSENQTHARLLRVSPDCIYSAHVNGSQETSIVNLCDRHGGLFGTLALEDGAYIIEPLDIHHSHPARQEDMEESETTPELKRVRRSYDMLPHLIYKSKSHAFEKPVVSSDSQTSFQNLSSSNEFQDNLFPDSYVNNTAWEDIQIRQERSRRSANSWDHFVEVLVVADYKMLLYHQGDLESYILTLFSTVASIYRHNTLRASINIIVVRILILKSERAGPLISNRAQDTLQQFCAWQQNYNDRNDDAINHHDVAILITRHDICRATNKCDTLGLAELGTMCDPLRSCAIIEDNGLSAAFTIAHELGHIFNIPHDDERKCGTYMALNKHNYHIMAPTLEYNTHPWSWSACSAAMLSKFLDANRAQTQCILDQPIERRYYDQMFENPAPGAKYSVNQQCQFVFGPSAEICPYMPTCRRLWCSTYYGYQMGCRTQHMPWADGTPCGDNMWCHRGQCVGMSPSQREKQDGAWGEWKAWGDCSRTCGGGVQKGLRDCDNPRPMNGGKYCVGQRERYRPCNIQECPWDTPGFREVQCSEFDNRDVGIHGVSPLTKWVPKYAGISENERCKLYCRAKDSAAFYLLRDKVLDGTPCDRNGDDICIDGTCHKAGCDHRLGSEMKRDVCGICGGDGSTCHTVEGVYNERVSFGYNEVFKIPAGSANIDITQKAHKGNKDDDNYLALRSANGEFILNGQYQVSVFRQQISIQDAVLEYSGSDQELERINGTGPIRSDIYLHVLCVGNLHPPNIHYKYMVPRSTDHRHVQQHHTTSFYWRIADYWTDCSAKCQGSQKQQLICVDALSNRQVNERHCTGHRPDIQQRMCNVDCFAKWQTKEISGCSARCGRGEKHQLSTCVLAYTNGREDPVADQECIQAGLPRPLDRAPCYSDCSGRKWAYSEWTTCSATCGTTGISRRNAYCIDDSNRQIDIRHCETIPREASETECNRIPCPKWVYGHWSECSRSCDGGIRIRHASCQNAAGQEVDQQFCSQTEKQDREKCNEHVCTQWKFGNWSPCSVTCGTGFETRSAQCIDREGRALSDDRCDHRERIVQKQCLQPDCPGWKLGSWSACSVSCMDGWSSRLVMCVDASGLKLPDEKCLKKGETRPPSHQPCNHGPCPFWRPTEWSTCSVPCGSGIRQREVECVYRDQIVDASLCPESQKPKIQEPCTLLACAFWDLLPWSSCSASCGSGVQRRMVQCVRGSNKLIVGERECKEEKPKTERACERDPCPNAKFEIYWATGPWTECSQSCGNGTQRRIVVCHDHIRELGAEYCTQLEKPPNTRECNIRPCAQWSVGAWQPCPATCGIHHVQRRRVSCVPIGKKKEIEINSVLDELPEIDCDPAAQPEAVRNCGLKACPVEQKPVYGNWTTSDWTECSVSCGNGWRRRKVQCTLELCIESKKPPVMEQCNNGECKKASWQITPWSSCSVTCGNGGYQERTVWCQNEINGGQKVDDSECLKDEKKPISRRGCALPTCIKTSNVLINPIAKTNSIDADSYTWQSGKWSTCSATCGRGIRQRTVECIDAYGLTASEEKCDLSLKPMGQQKCRLGHCPRWHKDKWSTCSATCGNGVKRRTVFCKKGKHQRVPDTECHRVAKPQETTVCQVGKCPVYYWKVTPWSKCTDPCKPSDQYRRVYCMSALHQRAAPRMCANETEPMTVRACPIDKCPYEWVPGPWSTCSRTCDKGFHFRRIDCKVKRSMRDPNTTLKYDVGSEPTVLSRMCMSLPKPEVNKECAMNPCDAPYRWSVLPWSPCSKSCGPGYRRRKTPCLDQFGNRVSRHHCDSNSRPSHREPCFLRNCLPNDCAEIKAQNTLTHSIDGNYTVLVAGFRISVYCHLMNETIPKTYINVRHESNFAEFYGKRLKYPYTCPFEGRRNDSCVCTNDGHVNMGFSRFKKLRVDLHNMKINPHDFTFVETLQGTPVPYGTAGDCYSMSDCPQGTFSIDLRHTGLRIVDDLQWVDHGHRTNSRIERAENNAFIRGYCGGYCGECAPDRFKGLVIEVDQKQKPSVGVG